MAPAFFLLFALQCLLPIFDTGSSQYVGLSIVNTDSQSREFTVTATSADGKKSQNGNVTLASGAQRALLVKEAVGLELPQTGWVRIESNANGAPCYLVSGTDASIAGAEGDTTGSTSLLLPHVSINTGFVELSYTDTQILVVNTGAAAANVTAQLVALDGTTKGTAPLTVSPGASFSANLSELFRDSLPKNSLGGAVLEGYAKLSANVPISAWLRVATPLAQSGLRGVTTSPFTNTVIPHFVTGGNYASFLNIVNPGSSETNTIELRAFNDNGTSIGETVQMTLGPGQARRVAVDDLFRIVTVQIFPPPLISGAISIRQASGTAGTQPPLFVSLEIIAISSTGKTASMLYPASYSASTSWLMPFATSATPYFTGYAVANASDTLTVQNDVQVEVVSSDGSVRSRSAYSLSPGTRQAALIPAGIAGGYLRFTSTFPIYVMGTIGTLDSKALESVPVVQH